MEGIEGKKRVLTKPTSSMRIYSILSLGPSDRLLLLLLTRPPAWVVPFTLTSFLGRKSLFLQYTSALDTSSQRVYSSWLPRDLIFHLSYWGHQCSLYGQCLSVHPISTVYAFKDHQRLHQPLDLSIISSNHNLILNIEFSTCFLYK